MIGFEVLRPELAWLLLLAPAVFLLGWRGLVRSRVELGLWVSERQRARFLPGSSRSRATLRLALAAGGVLFLALAALGPVRGYTWRAVSRRGLDLVVCLDTSRSMLAQDLRPSRLERAKREIRGLLDHLEGDRVALVAFSGDARDVAPLTRDRGTLEGLLGFVTPEDNQEGGTDLAAAIEHALALFDGRTGAHEAIVLLTDGEDLAGQAAAQAEEAARRGIRVFVVGVGTEAGGKIPVTEPDGRSAFLRDPDGQEVVTRLDRASLVALAARTGGEFLSAEEAPTALEDLYRARISRIEGREIEGGERRVPYDRFQWPLALGLACLLLELALRAGPRRAEGAGRGPLPVAALLPFLVLPSPFQEPPSFAHGLADAVRRHAAGEHEAALQAAEALLSQAEALGLREDERARAHFALGIIGAVRLLGDPPAAPEEREALRARALDALSAARALAGPGELRSDATYDLGVLELLHAEEVRATIPEISGQPPAPPAVPPGMPGVPGAGPEPPDPLEIAQGLYEAARGWLVERLRLDWRDEDTRANLELVQRRLRELERIREEREQQQQEQEPQPQDGQDSEGDSPPQEGDEKDGKEKKDKKEKPDQENRDPSEPKDGAEEPPPQDSEPKPGEEGPQPEEQGSEETPPENAGEEPPPEPEAGEPRPGQPEPGEERVLTREQVIQLLDRLSELEQQQQALEAALRARRRAATKRDW